MPTASTAAATAASAPLPVTREPVADTRPHANPFAALPSLVENREEDAMSLYSEATGASGAEAQAIIRTWDTTQNY